MALKFTSVSFLLLFNLLSYGQSSILVYTTQPQNDRDMEAILPDDSGHILVGCTNGGSYTFSTTLTQMSDINNVDWTLEHYTSYANNAMSYVLNLKKTVGGTYVGGLLKNQFNYNNGMFLYKIDNAGNVLWNKSFKAAQTCDLFQMIVCSDGGPLFCGEVNGSGCLLKFDTAGNLSWTTHVSNPNSEPVQYFSVAQLPNGNFAAAGETGDHWQGNEMVDRGLISLFSPTGSLISTVSLVLNNLTPRWIKYDPLLAKIVVLSNQRDAPLSNETTNGLISVTTEGLGTFSHYVLDVPGNEYYSNFTLTPMGKMLLCGVNNGHALVTGLWPGTTNAVTQQYQAPHFRTWLGAVDINSHNEVYLGGGLIDTVIGGHLNVWLQKTDTTFSNLCHFSQVNAALFPINVPVNPLSLTQQSIADTLSSLTHVTYQQAITVYEACGLVPACNASFVVYPDSTIAGTYYGFNTSTGSNLSYLWHFGDGDSSIQAYPSHQYAQPGQYYVCLTVNNGAGCTSTFCDSSFLVFKTENGLMNRLNILSPSGVKDVSDEEVIHLYPNPTTGVINITGPQIKDLRVYSLSGQLLGSIKQPSKNQLDVSQFRPGIYIAEIETQGTTQRFRWVKM